MNECSIETLTLYAVGLAEADQVRLIDDHLSACNSCRTELRSFQEAAASLAYALPDVNPPARVRERVLSNVGESRKAPLEQPMPGVFVLREPQQRWRDTPYPGVQVKILYADPVSKSVTSLLKLEPGAVYPQHRHAAVEQCLVLEGEVRIGQIGIKAGDFEFAAAGTHHPSVTTDSGCVLMIVSNQDDEVFA
jgi:predicted ChrR family anti-sigma factor